MAAPEEVGGKPQTQTHNFETVSSIGQCGPEEESEMELRHPLTLKVE